MAVKSTTILAAVAALAAQVSLAQPVAPSFGTLQLAADSQLSEQQQQAFINAEASINAASDALTQVFYYDQDGRLVRDPANGLAPTSVPGGGATISLMAVPGGGYTANGLRVAIPNPAIVPNKKTVFAGFDMRPKPGDRTGDVSGYQSSMAWTEDSVAKAVADAEASDGAKGKLAKTVIKSDKEFTDIMSISASIRGSGFGFSAEAKFGYDSSRTSTSSVVSGVNYAVMTTNGVMLANLNALELHDEAKQVLTTDVDLFLDLWGTHFIKTRGYGCEAVASYTYTCQSEAAKDEIATALGGKYNGLVASASAEVQSTFGKYSKSNTCQFNAQWTSIGVRAFNPSQSQMLDDQVMDSIFNNFSDECKAEAATSGQLLYAELGNWYEVRAVRQAVGNNATATAVLQAYAQGFSAADIQALSLGGKYWAKATDAVARAEQPSCAGFADPIAKTGFPKRGADSSDPWNVDPSYWASLPANHAEMQARVQIARPDQFLSAAAIKNATQSGQSLSTLVQNFFYNAKDLYEKAKQTYRYSWCNARAVFTSVHNNLNGMAQVSVPANGGMRGNVECKSVDINSDVYCSQPMYNVFGPDSNKRYLELWGGIKTAASRGNPSMPKLVLSAEGYVMDYFWTADKGYHYLVGFTETTLDPESSGSGALPITYNAGRESNCKEYLDKDTTTGEASCPKVAAELIMEWAMGDMSFAPRDPYRP